MFSASFSIDENYFTPEEDENETTDQPQTQPKSTSHQEGQDQTHAQNQYHGNIFLRVDFGTKIS